MKQTYQITFARKIVKLFLDLGVFQFISQSAIAENKIFGMQLFTLFNNKVSKNTRLLIIALLKHSFKIYFVLHKYKKHTL